MTDHQTLVRAELQRRYNAGERDIIVDAATFAVYESSLIANVREIPDGGADVTPAPRRLLFKNAKVSMTT